MLVTFTPFCIVIRGKTTAAESRSVLHEMAKAFYIVSEMSSSITATQTLHILKTPSLLYKSI